MREKKMRGINRKTTILLERIKAYTETFPTDFYHGYWHLHLPASQAFIDSPQTPEKAKRACIQALVDQAEHLVRLKPSKNYRVVALITSPELWGSQIIVFKGDDYFTRFFDRNSDDQKWVPLPKSRNLQTEKNLLIPSYFNVSGVTEMIIDEDGTEENEIWFVGELK
ncbi:DUF3916 domain-containing protein [Priestia koreensis]|uniref:DUF3916 domain-containing protein n=1 Tax=Priestia koreensis TaxID=284581 RepID=UPI001F564383|nr:DUF3916 domain-containing protein [Priestia koreensis]UNL83338.1 DUF3916 domain-containing protein [Priestia koreensis]